ncbi:hypothetical protein ABPG77_001762 [Micractinium sp. CCAP 211/92]
MPSQPACWALAALVLLGAALPAAAGAGRSLQVQGSDDSAPPKSVPYSGGAEYASTSALGYIPNPPLASAALVHNVSGMEPDQIHVTYWGPGALLFSWATGEGVVGPGVRPANPKGVGSWVLWGEQSGEYTQNATSNISLAYVAPYTNASLDQLSYASPLLHHVLVTDLTPGSTLYYVVGDPELGELSEEYSITVPPAPTLDSLPFRIGVIADVGITLNSSDTLAHVMASKPQLVWLIGDVCYADQFLSNGTHTPKGYPTDYHTYQPIWDAFGRLLEPLSSSIPFNFIQGNHEIEPMMHRMRPGKGQGQGAGQGMAAQYDIFKSLNARWPVPQDPTKVQTQAGQATFTPTLNDYHPDPTATTVNGYYAQDVPGAHVMWLSAHIPFDQSSPQYKWFMADIKAVNRSATPWLLVNIHVPFYSSYADQFKVNEAMRTIYEPLFLHYGVDLVLSGHVHSYERTKPVYNYTVDECGPVHLIVGDGGNVEGMAAEFIDVAQPDYCKNTTLYPAMWFIANPDGKPLITLQDGQFCPTSQPAWSAYREPSFGHGILTIQNATHALWEWHKNQVDDSQVSDSVMLTRGSDSEACTKARAAAGAAGTSS